jgi:hypothetical protein
MVNDLSLAPCADSKILTTRYFERIRLRMKNSTRSLVLVRKLATAGARQDRSGVGDKDRPPSCEIIKDLETFCRSPSPTWVNFTTIKYRQRIAGMPSNYHRATV